jgi:hypothetical protein
VIEDRADEFIGPPMRFKLMFVVGDIIADGTLRGQACSR